MHIIRLVLFLMSFSIATISYAQKEGKTITIDSLPESQIDIPLQVSLLPIYKMAEKKVDTVFTSPHYPDDWVQADCATRYKYHFRRSPFKMTMNGTRLDLSFTGYYQIIGSTRACVNNTVLSPWTPGCKCGFDEPERKVEISFTSNFTLQPDYKLITRIIRNEPKALDKCTVCFWGQDVTNSVITGLKAELDASKKEMESAYAVVNLRSYLQQAWNKMNESYSIPGIGYFSLHPKKMRMQNINAKNDLLNITIGISATPAVTLIKSVENRSEIPNLSNANNPGGFNIYLEAALQYDSLSSVINSYMVHKRFDFNEGIFKNHIIIEEAKVYAGDSGNLRISVAFSGSYNGIAYFDGRPVYNEVKKSIEIEDIKYDLKTKNLLLKTAKWLFSNKITSELKKYTSIDISSYYEKAKAGLNGWMNREWTRGIRGTGSVQDIHLTAVYALPEHLLIRSNCNGKLNVEISEIDLKL